MISLELPLSPCSIGSTLSRINGSLKSDIFGDKMVTPSVAASAASSSGNAVHTDPAPQADHWVLIGKLSMSLVGPGALVCVRRAY